MAVIAGERAGIWKIADPILIREPRQPGEHRRGVRAVRLRGPDRVEPCLVGLSHELELVGGLHAESPIAHVQAEPH
jgi:hypothetical protein